LADTRAAALAQRIAADLAQSGLAPGLVFASAAELRTRYGANEAALRQAVLILEERGVAFTRRGVGGGLIVGAPDSGAAARAASVYLAFAGATARDCNTVSRTTNLLTALSARRGLNLDKVDNLRAEADRLETGKSSRIAERHARLRALIAAALGDPVLAFVAQATNQFLMDVLPESSDSAVMEVRMLDYWRNTRQKLDAYMGGDIAASVRLHEENIALNETELASDPEAAGQASIRAAAPSRQADAVARALVTTIRKTGWPTGARIGSEPELMARFGVTRAILRQAVRLLELRSAARMQRGPNGGLMVAAPDRQATIDHVIGHLREAGATPFQARTFRRELLLSQLGQPDIELTKAQLKALREAADPARNSDVWSAGRHLQMRLLHLTDNPVIEFCGAFLDAFDDSHRNPPAPQDLDYASKLLEVLVASHVVHDGGRARRAFLDYAELDERHCNDLPIVG
jgi:DNA-binding FadR family transcriptional regulator